jgi:hypothetical protein
MACCVLAAALIGRVLRVVRQLFGSERVGGTETFAPVASRPGPLGAARAPASDPLAKRELALRR